MFKNLFSSKKKSDKVMEALTMSEYGQHSEDLHIDTASGHAIEDVIEDEDEYAYYSEACSKS